MLTEKTHGHLRPRPDRSGLSVTRKTGQAIVIRSPHGQTVTVIVQSARGNRVRLRVLAPPEIRVDRDELLEREDAATTEAA